MIKIQSFCKGKLLMLADISNNSSISATNSKQSKLDAIQKPSLDEDNVSWILKGYNVLPSTNHHSNLGHLTDIRISVVDASCARGAFTVIWRLYWAQPTICHGLSIWRRLPRLCLWPSSPPNNRWGCSQGHKRKFIHPCRPMQRDVYLKAHLSSLQQTMPYSPSKLASI